MKREQRRVRIARRQALLAEVSQRAAMRGLADAIAEETRSATLAERSRDLTQTYGGRSQALDGATLGHSARFAGALAQLANEADAARSDAAKQSEWQIQALGQAQTRARRHVERLERALVAYQKAQDRREDDPSLATVSAKAADASRRLAQPVQTDDLNAPSAQTRHPRTAS